MVGDDPVTSEVADFVRQRDGGCVAPQLDPEVDACELPIQFDHVKDQPKIGAPVVKRGPERRHRYRAPSDPAHLVSVCRHHHLEGWATAHRPLLRDYLSRR